jgi:hypothetical protein
MKPNVEQLSGKERALGELQASYDEAMGQQAVLTKNKSYIKETTWRSIFD